MSSHKTIVPPKVVVFDLGKVLLDFDYGKSSRRFAERSKATAAQVEKFINHSPLLFQYETGLISQKQFYQQVQSASGFAGDSEEFAAIFSDIFEPITPMIEIHAALRKGGMPVYIFSNTNDIAIDHIRRTYPFYSEFDGYVLSYEHGAMKPHEKLYEAVEGMTGRQREEIIYLDDRAENVAAGAVRGWRAVLHETPEKTRTALLNAGLEV